MAINYLVNEWHPVDFNISNEFKNIDESFEI